MYYSSSRSSVDLNGVGEYFAATSLGQAASAATGPAASSLLDRMAMATQQAPAAILDLQNPDAVIQLKSAMGLAPFMMPIVFGEDTELDFDEVFFNNPVWDAKATKFARIWLDEYKKAFPNIQNADSLFVTPHLYPSSVGVIVILALLGYGQPIQGDVAPVDFNALPALTNFYDTTGGDPSKGSVKAPMFSSSEGGVVQANTIAMVGLGVLGIIALGLVFGGKKRRK